jgi:hypothetical protein
MNDRDMGRRIFLMQTAGVVAGLASVRAFAADAQPDEPAAEEGWTPLFNGKDLSGWKAEGKAVWKVEEKCLVGTQGPGAAPGDLFTVKEFDDFELRVTMRVQWPANSGIWFRYQAADKAYQADILDYKEPEAYSGTLYCPGRMFLAINKDASLYKRDGWNTFLIHAKGDHLVITLNKVVTADVHDGAIARGRIGFQIHPGDQFKDMKVTVREILLRNLAS